MNPPAQAPGIARRFSAAAETYEGLAAVQNETAGRVLALCPPPVGIARILEIGCGTGLLTRRLAAQYPQAQITAMDVAEHMIRRAQQNVPSAHLHWRVADAAQFQAEPPYDLMASNCAVHWVQPLEPLFVRIRPWLNPGGTFVFSMMLYDTFHELHSARLAAAPQKPPHTRLPSFDQVLMAVQNAGFSLEVQKHILHREVHPSVEAFLQFIHNMGLTGGAVSRAPSPLTRGELRRVAEHYSQAHADAAGAIPATYAIGLFKATRR